MLLLAATASIGVVLYLNLKAGPSFGHGVLPDDAPHEARERDYFFVLAFWIWGAWAGAGAVSASRSMLGRAGRRSVRGRSSLHAVRSPRVATAVGLLLATAPVVLNWRAVDRRRGGDAKIALAAGRALLASAPRNAVLLTAGDLDSYPIWYLQAVRRERQDVAVVVVPMLPAAWYRRELGRRHGLLAVPAGRWEGTGRTLAAIGEGAHGLGRPLAASALLPRAVRAAAATEWVAAGVLQLRWDGSRLTWLDTLTAARLDTLTAARTAALIGGEFGHQLADPAAPDDAADPAGRMMRRLLACAPLVARAGRSTGEEAASRLLASWCNWP